MTLKIQINRDEARRAIADILRQLGLALSAVHNTIATDDPTAVEDETHWRVNSAGELVELDRLTALLGLLLETEGMIQSYDNDWGISRIHVREDGTENWGAWVFDQREHGFSDSDEATNWLVREFARQLDVARRQISETFLERDAYKALAEKLHATTAGG